MEIKRQRHQDFEAFAVNIWAMLVRAYQKATGNKLLSWHIYCDLKNILDCLENTEEDKTTTLFFAIDSDGRTHCRDDPTMNTQYRLVFNTESAELTEMAWVPVKN